MLYCPKNTYEHNCYNSCISGSERKSIVKFQLYIQNTSEIKSVNNNKK